mgnify:CR=1 FL=1
MISDILEKKELICSLEVFPPKKTDDVHIVYKAIDEMKSVEPDFISVTYGAGGGTSKETLAIASYIYITNAVLNRLHILHAPRSQKTSLKFIPKK